MQRSDSETVTYSITKHTMVGVLPCLVLFVGWSSLWSHSVADVQAVRRLSQTLRWVS